MLLVPQNGFFVLQYAEALYTTAEYSTAYKAFLRVLDMGGLIEKSAGGVVAKGPEVRALWGLKAVSRLIECRNVDPSIGDKTAHSSPLSSSFAFVSTPAQTIGKLRDNPKKGTNGDIKVDQLDAVEQLVQELLHRAYGPKSDQATAAELKSLNTSTT